jgi:hypothetical protein
MQKLHLNDTEVCTSPLTQRSYRAAGCELLVCVTPQNRDAALKAFRDDPHSYSGLHVSGIADVGFLADFSNLRYLEVVDQKKFDARQLAPLTNLRGLRLETPGAGIDFAWFPELEGFCGDWHADNINVRCCRELRHLRAWQFKPKSKNLADIAGATRLERLSLTQTNIATLDGLESLEDLRYLELAYALQLEPLEALARPGVDLREIEIAKAKKIASYRPLAEVRRLRRLKLSSCAPMADLTWTAGMNHLDFISFVETPVENGDLAPLLELPRLRYVGTMGKKHYNYKCDALNQVLQERTKTDEFKGQLSP